MARVVPTPISSPARHRLNELLADGEWHSIEEAIAVMVRHIEPGKAYREAERRRVAGLVDGSVAGGARSRGDETVAVAAGARAKASAVIRTATRSGTIERDGDCIRTVPR